MITARDRLKVICRTSSASLSLSFNFVFGSLWLLSRGALQFACTFFNCDAADALIVFTYRVYIDRSSSEQVYVEAEIRVEFGNVWEEGGAGGGGGGEREANVAVAVVFGRERV